jgi:hypothetical protein
MASLTDQGYAYLFGPWLGEYPPDAQGAHRQAFVPLNAKACPQPTTECGLSSDPRPRPGVARAAANAIKCQCSCANGGGCVAPGAQYAPGGGPALSTCCSLSPQRSSVPSDRARTWPFATCLLTGGHTILACCCTWAFTASSRHARRLLSSFEMPIRSSGPGLPRAQRTSPLEACSFHHQAAPSSTRQPPPRTANTPRPGARGQGPGGRPGWQQGTHHPAAPSAASCWPVQQAASSSGYRVACCVGWYGVVHANNQRQAGSYITTYCIGPSCQCQS